MSKTESNLNTLINDTVNQLTKHSPGKNGLVRKVYLIDRKEWYEFNKPDDFGDHMPYIIEATNSVGFAKKQYLLWKKRMVKGIPVPKHKLPLPPLLESKNVDDFLHGMAVIYKATGDNFFLSEGVKLCTNIENNLKIGKAFASVKIPFLNIPLPDGCSALKPTILFSPASNFKYFAEASSNGVIAEKFIDFSELASQRKFLISARECIDAWLNTKTYKRYHLFPDKAFFVDSPSSKLMKTNSNFGFALLRSIKSPGGEYHKKKLQELLDAIEQKYSLDSGMTNDFVAGKKQDRLSIIAVQAYCSLLFNTSFILGSKLRKKAYNLAFFVKKKMFIQNSPLGYLLDELESDGLGDFLVLLMQLDEDHKHTEFFETMLTYITRKYYIGNGLWRDYSPRSMQQTAHSKYLGGVLKYLLCYKAYGNKEDLTSGKWSYLLQDR